jgi:3-hydroxy-9,10-secoandrosta-1,3,5(10)-triene-9,17-dione monooxygenase
MRMAFGVGRLARLKIRTTSEEEEEGDRTMAVETDTTAGKPGGPSVDELVARASALVPTLRERSAHCEELRKIPEETVADFKAAEFLRIAEPVGFGGLGLDVAAITEVAMEVGRGCASSAWMAGQWPGHNFMVGYWPLETQEEYFATDGPDTMSSTASAIVKLDAKEEKDGLRVSGQFKFSSGCDYAEWLLVNVPPFAQCLVPKSDFTIDDDWYVMGLRGTGSKAVILNDVFIPKPHIVPLEMLMRGRPFGADIYPDNPYYRIPFHIPLNTMLLASIIGTARGLIDIFDERVLKRMDGHTQQPAFQRPGTQLRFAEATAEVDAAMLVARDVQKSLQELGGAEEEVPLMERARLRRNIGYAARLCLQAADRLLESGDASGNYDSSPFQRWGRDIHMAGLQFVCTWDEPALAYSRVRWGLAPEAFTT